MDTVTYPDENVGDLLSRSFTCLKINMLERHPDFKEASGNGRVIFGPTLLFSDARGREHRRYLGWLPPVSFLGELQFVLAMHEFNRGQFMAARDLFHRVREHYGSADVTPEAIYWEGIAGFLGGNKDAEALRTCWNEVRHRFPDSTWATRAEAIDDLAR